MAEKTIGNSYPKALSGGMHDAIIGGEFKIDMTMTVTAAGDIEHESEQIESVDHNAA